MLLAVPKYGRVKVNKMLLHCRVVPSQDDRRALRPPARGAGLAAAPLAGPRRGACARHHRTLRGGQGHADPRPDGAHAASCSCRSRRRRAPARPGEREGVDYHFLSPEEFERRVREGISSSTSTTPARRYGTLRSELEGRACARACRSCSRSRCRAPARCGAALPDATQVFIAPPSLDALRTRLVRARHRRPARRSSGACGSRSEELDARSRSSRTWSSTTSGAMRSRSSRGSCVRRWSSDALTLQCSTHGRAGYASAMISPRIDHLLEQRRLQLRGGR